MLYTTEILRPVLQAIYDRAYQEMLARPHLQALMRLATEVPSTSAVETYAWLGDVPGVREWIGDKTLGGLKDYKYQIRNKDFYTGFSIDANELADDQIAAISPRVGMLAMAVAQWPARMLIDLIINGHTNLAFDGVAFFASGATNRGDNSDNLIAGTGVTLAEIRADISAARAAMSRFESDNGQPMGLRMNTIVCPPELETVFREAVNAASSVVVVGGSTVVSGANPIASYVNDVISIPELSDTNDWYGFATDFPLRPLIFQNRRAAMPHLDDTQLIRNRKLDYSADMRGNAGYGFWQMGIKVTNT